METLYLTCINDSTVQGINVTNYTEMICSTDATPIFYLLMFHFALLVVLIFKK